MNCGYDRGEFSPAEKSLSQTVQQWWTSFAAGSSPVADWPVVSAQLSRSFFRAIDVSQSENVGLTEADCEFWASIDSRW